MSTFFFIFSLVLSSLSFQPSLSVAVGPKNNGGSSGSPIARACDSSPHKEVCLSIIQSDPSSKTADIRGLATIALKLAIKNTTEISVRFKNLLQNNTLEPGLQDMVYNCNKQYLDAVSQIEHAVVGFNMKDYRNVETWMKTAATEILTCQLKAKDVADELASELFRKSHSAHQLVTTALSVVHAVAQK